VEWNASPAAPIWPAHSVLYLSVPTFFGEEGLARLVVHICLYHLIVDLIVAPYRSTHICSLRIAPSRNTGSI